MDLTRWQVFSNLSPNLISKVRLAYTCGTARGGYLVTNNDDVYCIGEHWFSGNKCELELPHKIDALCGKGIKSFHSGCSETLALTTSGQLWSISDRLKAVVVLASIIDVAVGKHHMLALHSGGKFFSWGRNHFGQLGTGPRSSSAFPIQYANVNDEHRIVSVACSAEASFAMTHEGDVLSWGRRRQNGQCTDLYFPRMLLRSKTVTQIVCGQFQGYGLTKEGKLFCWGMHVGDEPWKPREICKQIGPIAEIAGSCHHEFYVCRITSKNICVGGKWFGQIPSGPVQTKYKSVDEAFACYKIPTMWRTLTVQRPSYSNLLKSFESALNDEETSDVEFLVEGKTIFAHRVFLKFRVPYFRSMFENHWKDMENFTHDVFNAFMTYVYTETVQTKSSTDLYGLLEAADYYNVQDLLAKCEELLKVGIQEGNVCTIYTLAVRHNAKDLQMCALQYIIPRFSEVVNSKDFMGMEPDVKNQLIRELAHKRKLVDDQAADDISVVEIDFDSDDEDWQIWCSAQEVSYRNTRGYEMKSFTKHDTKML